jgi:lipopolysaccharide/colanic/teichoic acid biosynthesis glycosyltransferase
MAETIAQNKIKIESQTFPSEPWFTSLDAVLCRLRDLLGAALGLILLAPFFAVVAWRLKREGPGPVFYRGPRSGRHGKVFDILKFRTMTECPESYQGPKITARDDERVTPIGHWLRDTKLNELPQLWNVLKGEMSLVGPRPEDPEFVAAWPEDARREILSVRPGLTSPASVIYHDEEQRLSSGTLIGDYLNKLAPDKLRLDLLYVRHHSFFTDLDAIFWTLIILIPRLGRVPSTEGMLFGGPFTRSVRSYLNWFSIDLIVAFLGTGLVGVGWRLYQPLHIGWDHALVVVILLPVLFSSMNAALGLKRVVWSRAAPEDIFRLLLASTIVMVVGLTLDYFLHISTPHGFIFIVSVVVLAGFITVRYRLRLVTGFASRWVRLRTGSNALGERVLVVGAGRGGEFATWLLRRADFQRRFTIVGFADDAPTLQGMRLDGFPVLGTTADIPCLVEKYDIGLVFFAIGDPLSSADSERILARCRQTRARLVDISDVIESLQLQLMIKEVG